MAEESQDDNVNKSGGSPFPANMGSGHGDGSPAGIAGAEEKARTDGVGVINTPPGSWGNDRKNLSGDSYLELLLGERNDYVSFRPQAPSAGQKPNAGSRPADPVKDDVPPNASGEASWRPDPDGDGRRAKNIMDPVEYDRLKNAIAERAFHREKIDDLAVEIKERRFICFDAAYFDANYCMVHALYKSLGLNYSPIHSVDADNILGRSLQDVIKEAGIPSNGLIFIHNMTQIFLEFSKSSKGDELKKYLGDNGYYVIVTCAPDEKNEIIEIPDGAFGPGNCISYLVAKYCPDIDNPPAIADKIIERLSGIKGKVSFRRWRVMDVVIRRLKGLVSEDLVDRFPAEFERACGGAAPDEPEDDGGVRKTAISALQFVGVHFGGAEMSDFLASVRHVLTQLDELDPIETGKEGAGLLRAFSKKEQRKRLDEFERSPDDFLREAGLVVRPSQEGWNVVAFGAKDAEGRIRDSFNLTPLASERYFQVLLSLARRSQTFQFAWHERMRRLCGVAALRGPGETQRRLMAQLAEPEINISIYHWWWVISGLANLPEGEYPQADSVLTQFGKILAGSDEHRPECLFMILQLEMVEKFRRHGWLGHFVDRLSVDDAMISKVIEYFDYQLMSSQSNVAEALSMIVGWHREDGRGGTRHAVAVRFLDESILFFFDLWLVKEPKRNPYDFPLLRLAEGGEQDVDVLAGVIAAWLSEDRHAIEEAAQSNRSEPAGRRDAAFFVVPLIGLAARSGDADRATEVVKVITDAAKRSFQGRRPADLRALATFKRRFSEHERAFVEFTRRADQPVLRLMHRLFAHFRMKI